MVVSEVSDIELSRCASAKESKAEGEGATSKCALHTAFPLSYLEVMKSEGIVSPPSCCWILSYSS